MKTPTINSRVVKLEVLKGTATRTSVNAVESRTTSLEGDVATAQSDISTLQGDVTTLTQGIQDAVSTHNTAPDAHADIRTALAGKQDSLTISDVGEAMLALATPSGQKIPRVNADGSVVLINVPSGDGVGGSSWYASDDGPPSVDLSLSWVSNGDANGVFRALGTESGAWSNPALSGRIRSLASSIYSDSVTAGSLTDRATTNTTTNDVANSWFAFDLGAGTTVSLDSYSLQGRGSYSDNQIRTWAIQGSSDVSEWTVAGVAAASWTTLDSRTSDTTISGAGVWGHWACAARSAPFRFIRIVQTGPNSSGKLYLGLSEVELYGLVTAPVDKPAWTTGLARNAELIDDATAWMPYYATSALTDGTPIFGTAYDVASAVSTHNVAGDSHADLRTLIGNRALSVHQHARADLPWVTEPGAALLTAASASAQRTALGMTAWAVAPWTDGTTSDIPEGTQLYFTDARADARIAAQKGQADGIMPLDSGGKAPLAYMPDALIGQVKFKGVWDAATNSPVLPSATTSMGHYYVTSVAGSYGGIDYGVGDWCISDGTTWGKVDNSDAITSFAGRTGAILPISSDYSAHYLGLHAQADDSARLGGQLPSYYAANGHTHAQSSIDISTGWITTALVGKQASGNYAAGVTAGGDAYTARYCSGTSEAANKLVTARTLTIGSKANTFDGSADKAWTLAEIGAASTTALTTEETTRASSDNALWAALYAEQTGGTTCEIPLAATGDGSGVLTLRLWSDVANTATISAGAFYGEIGGTTNLGQSVAMTAGQFTTFYIKLPASATATLTITYGWALTKWGQIGTECIVEATNAPKLNGFDVKYIPQNVTTIRIYSNLGASIVTGSTRSWTSAMNIMFDGNLMAISGTTYPWASATYILFYGDSMTISGATYHWASATYIRFVGNSMTISGTTYPWTSATYIIFIGDSMTLSGTTYPWTAATFIYFQGSSMTLSGTTYPWTSAATILFYGNSMTLSGTTYPWVAATVVYFLGNSMTLSGTTYPWTTAATIRFEGNSMTLSGTTYPWTSATDILFYGNSMTLSGTTYPWTSATFIYFQGSSMTLSGTTYPWASATTILFEGNSMTLSGTTYPWVAATRIQFYGNSMTLTANLSTSCLTTGNLYLYLSGTGIAVTYTTTRIWPTTMQQVYLRPSVGSMPTADTDRLFIDVDATCTTASTEKVLDARGNCGAVTAASSAARTSLVAKGFAVSYNS